MSADETQPLDALLERVETLARTPVLLVGCDYDGTIAPIVDDPAEAHPWRETVVALRSLAALERTQVAVISGRALRDLAQLSGLVEPVRLVGSHGSEFDPDFAERLGPEQRALRERVLRELREIAARTPGASVEAKPASAALHYRTCDEAAGRAALEAVLAGPAALEGVRVQRGKMVVELLLVSTNKGDALEEARRRIGATAVVFLGDDETDELAFATLAGPDVGVKVGAGPTRARYRVADTEDVARVLARLCELRERHTVHGTAVPIERHSMLSDHRTAALVTPDARVTWLCLPRLDSPALFAELLDGAPAGHFTVSAADGSAPVEQVYREGSLVLETRWPTFRVTDFLDCSMGRPRQRAGRSDLLRLLEGEGRVRIEFAPRLDFGRVPTELVPHDFGLRIEGWRDPLVLRSPRVRWELRREGPHHTAVAELDLPPEGVVLDLRYGTGSLEDTTRDAGERARLTDAHWRSWASRLELPATERALVLRSALTLRALCYTPTGAVAAAATTSLPEHLGGVRNWDYRFCWPRDAALAARALLLLGSAGEALALLDWVLGIVDHVSAPSALQPLYGLGGEEVPSEGEIGELSGYRGSRPVRVANSAAHQVQLDVFGPVVDLIHEMLVREAPVSPEHWRLVEAMVDAVAQRWREPDHGIWELRLPPRQHVHSKTMCWVTLDRAVRVARLLLDEDRPSWALLRDEIAAEVVAQGWNERVGAFTTSYGSDELDAAALHVGLSGLLPPDDPRFAATVDVIARELREGPVVYRYRFDDGLPGREGGFLLCASWLVDALLLVGRAEEARELFGQLVGLAGPTGLLSEQHSPSAGCALGNVPQAYSHLGLVLNALHLDAARR